MDNCVKYFWEVKELRIQKWPWHAHQGLWVPCKVSLRMILGGRGRQWRLHPAYSCVWANIYPLLSSLKGVGPKSCHYILIQVWWILSSRKSLQMERTTNHQCNKNPTLYLWPWRSHTSSTGLSFPISNLEGQRESFLRAPSNPHILWSNKPHKETESYLAFPKQKTLKNLMQKACSEMIGSVLIRHR